MTDAAAWRLAQHACATRYSDLPAIPDEQSSQLRHLAAPTGRKAFSVPTREAKASIGHGDLARHISRCRAGKEHDHLGDVPTPPNPARGSMEWLAAQKKSG